MFEVVAAQAALVRGLGGEPVVFAAEDAYAAEDRWRLGGAEVHYAAAKGPGFLAYAPDLTRLLAAADLDLLHLHGIWQWPSHAAGIWARRSGRPLAISPHGMLDPWITGRNAWKKQLARIGWERRSWRAAAAFHALTAAEAADIARECPGAQVAIIPNAAPPATAQTLRPRAPMVLYLGRIHAKKNLAALVAGWLKAKPHLPEGALLTIAGWGDDAGIALLREAMVPADGSVEFVGTAFGSQKAALLDAARFMALPSLSEGLPMAVLEAWAAGVPTIMSEACHLPEGFAAGAAIPSGMRRDTIAAAFLEAFAKSEAEWLAMAEAARALAEGAFAAATIAQRYAAFYAGLLNGPARG